MRCERSKSSTERPDSQLATQCIGSLRRGLARADGFALFVAVVNSPAQREIYIKQLNDSMPAVELTRVSIAAETTDALNEVLGQIPEDSSGPIMLVGLEQAVPSDRKHHPILEKLNLSRPQWPQLLVRPVVFWIPDYLLGLMGRFAPDFLDWRSDTVYLPTLNETGIDEFKRMTTSGGIDDSLPLDLRLDRIAELKSRLKSHSASSDPVVLSATVDWRLELANHAETLARFDEAVEYNTTALAIAEELLGLNHPKVALCLNNLAGVLQVLGDLEGAKEYSERALSIIEETLDPNHRDVATYVNNLGNILQTLGDLERAKECFEHALKIDNAVYGPSHPSVARDANNLGLVLKDLGDLDGARKCYDRALKIDETAYGPDHPDVATDVNNLGDVLRALGDLDGARKCHDRALKIDEAIYGPDHPKVATDVNNLGGVLFAQGNLDGAKKCYDRALKIDEAAYGADHPDVATDVNNLGFVLLDQGDIRGALEHVQRALRIREARLGPDHPKTKKSRQDVEIVRKQL